MLKNKIISLLQDCARGHGEPVCIQLNYSPPECQEF